jgi:hypothetical protein
MQLLVQRLMVVAVVALIQKIHVGVLAGLVS